MIKLNNAKLKARILELASAQCSSISRVHPSLLGHIAALVDDQLEETLTRAVRQAVAQHRRGTKSLKAPIVASLPAARRRKAA